MSGFESHSISISIGGQTVKFSRQLDYVRSWWKDFNREQVFDTLDVLLSHLNAEEIRKLSSVIEPIFHRDFMYGAQREHPPTLFRPISTPLSRLTRKKLENSLRIENQRLYRPQSALITTKEDIGKLLRSRHHHTPTVDAAQLRERRRTCPPAFPSPQTQFRRDVISAPAGRRGLDRRKHMFLDDISLVCFNEENRKRSRLRLQSAPPIMMRGMTTKTSETEQVQSRIKQIIHWFSKYWSEQERATGLAEIVYLLNSKELYHLAGLLSLTQYRDFIAQLPAYISAAILMHLPPKDIVAVQKVCRRWNEIGSSDEIWHKKCLESIINITKEENVSWKDVFTTNAILDSNRQRGKYTSSKLLGHSESVLCCAVDGRRLATGSRDKTIMLWDLHTGVPVMVLTGHLRGVWCLNFHDRTLLVSGSHDSTIKIWNVRTGLCERTLLAHEGPVWCLAIKASILVTGSQDKKIRVWNLRNCQCKRALSEHTAAVFAVTFNDDGSQIFSGSADRTIRFWSAKKYLCIRVIKASSSHSVMSISYNNGLLASCSNTSISLWNVASGQRIQTFTGHKKRVETIYLRIERGGGGSWEGIIISGGKDNQIKYWNIKR